MINLYNGDCLEVMDSLIEKGVVVDAIICDPPYGTTACKWDTVIPFEAMWERLNKLIKPNGAIVLFGSEPFSSALRMSNIKMYKYDWVWEKTRTTLFQHANKRPMSKHEIISVFYKKSPTYNPQFTKGKPYKDNRTKRNIPKGLLLGEGTAKNRIPVDNKGKRFPVTVIRDFFESKGNVHPTQKPVALMEYLIRTYTNENETVLDFTMGSGTTGVACVQTNRKFIGIELDPEYFKIAEKRISNTEQQIRLTDLIGE